VVDGLEHAWSGGDARFPFNDPSGPDASELIWDFFEEHRRDARSASDRHPARGVAIV
jgi:poly(3-hydroxybutyrate) depolymerase